MTIEKYQDMVVSQLSVINNYLLEIKSARQQIMKNQSRIDRAEIQIELTIFRLTEAKKDVVIPEK